MTDEPRPSEPEPAISEAELAWAAEHMPSLRRSVFGREILYTSLAIAFVVGLVAHVVGFLLANDQPELTLRLIADLLSNFGIALWIGCVLVVFVQVLPDVRQRAAKRYLDALEAAVRERRASTKAGGHQNAPRP